MRKIELLAPAGSMEALKAAVENGADAVYLGGMDFGARAYASNFDKETIVQAVEYAHIRDVKIYITVNTLIKDNEIEDFMEYIKFLYENDIDAVIVQDIGAFKLIREFFKDFQVHASTQMTLHNKHGVRLLKDLGASRGVLARELTVEEVKDIYDETELELEVFVHGALCVSYSGQCLMSSLIGGRSGNRGRCAQPCRREYELLNLEQPEQNTNKAFHLSMRDLNTMEEVGQLIDAGVTSFKIEGRMKRPEYVASTVKAYRQAIDYYLAKKESLKDKALEEEMEQMFNRKFTKGYLFNTSKIDVINIEKPNNRGLYLGEVQNYNKDKKNLEIKLEVDLAEGDGIEVWNNKSGDIGGAVKGIYMDSKLITNASKGETVEIYLRGKIQKGDKVYKTLNKSLINELERTYSHGKNQKKIDLYGEINLRVNETIKLHLWDKCGNVVYGESTQVVEVAKNMPITEEKVLEQISKLGNTPFQIANLKIEIEKDSAISLSVLNGLRRDAVDQLISLRKDINKRQTKNGLNISKELKDRMLRAYSIGYGQAKKTGLCIKLDKIEQLKIILQYPIDRIYYGDIGTFKAAILLCKEKNVEIYLRVSSILRNEEYDRLAKSIEGLRFDGILAGDLGIIEFNNKHWKLPIIGDASLNIMNSYSVKLLEELELDSITLSTELDFKNIYELKLGNILDKEAIIYGKMLSMITEYCPLIHENKCNHKCQECDYPKYEYNFGIKDIKNMVFPIGKDYWGRSMILNSQPLFMLDKLKDFKGTGVNWFRLELTDENTEEIKIIMGLALRNINRLMGTKSKYNDEFSTYKPKEGFTRGLYYRGVE